MRKSLISVLLIALLSGMLAACSPAATPTAPAPTEAAAAELKDVKVVFLLTQPLSPFEDDIWQWVNKAQADGLTSEVKLIEMKNPTEYEQTIRQVAEQGYNVIISTFFYVKEAFNKVAPDFPDTNFVLVYETNDNDYPNMRGYLYDVQEGSYVCGVVAANMTETNRVGFIGGDNNPGIVKFLAGYEAGLKSVNPDIQLDVTFAGTFIDPDKGHEMALALYDRGDDVIMHAANMTGLGLFTAAKEEGKYAIGVDIDQSDQAPESVICSALSNPGPSVYNAISDTATGKWNGTNVSWGIDDGVTSVALTDLVPDEVRAAAEAAEADIASGKVVPPQTTETE
ncbi:MAG: BMP family ABC transporter substrate-binding protein [Chloroflexi bacterium]|nr:BMP family ABC transporter substrate-binding protein [Chloroflexota bacterium]